jgi:homoserine O-acetyltransferase
MDPLTIDIAPSASCHRHGGWRPGDPSGQRQFSQLFCETPLELELGGRLGPLTMAWESWGQLNGAADNAVLLLHGFSGDSHAAGPAGPGHGAPGWWDDLIGPGRALDTDRFFVLCPNVLGGCQGSSGPSSPAPDGRPWGPRFPALTIRDLVAAERQLAIRLGIFRWHAVIGGSMGGMRALEWAIEEPQRVERLLLLATAARCSAENIPFHICQIEAIRQDPNFLGGDYYDDPSGGPQGGLALARSIATITYGCERELDQRFAAADPLGREQAIAAFLASESQQLVRRFDANSYIALTQAMNRHDVGRGRGGIVAALARIKARVRLVAVASDRLFPPHRHQELAAGLRSGVTFSTLESQLGHDAYMLEAAKLSEIVRQSLG